MFSASNKNSSSSSPPPSDPFSSLDNNNITVCNDNQSAAAKRKRRPAGTPDPDAEVVSLSPRTLMESDRYVCEICNQGFQRDQNLQMHRRRHKVPWKLLKRESSVVKKRVFVCPEPTCLHHDPCHALGDLVGIKKHFRRKHSNQKQWVCDKCNKGYAVQSDYKAHLKTCGTRGHSCDCGRVFSRVESFIEHQDACTMGRQSHSPTFQQQQPTACLSRTASSPSPSTETPPWPMIAPPPRQQQHQHQHQHQHQQQQQPPPPPPPPSFMSLPTSAATTPTSSRCLHNLDLQLASSSAADDDSSAAAATQLHLSVGSSSDPNREVDDSDPREQMRLAMAEKAYAEEVRKEAKRQIQLAEEEFANAKRTRQRAQAELDKAEALREHAVKQMNTTMLQLTCASCRQKWRRPPPAEENNELALSYVSSGITEQGEAI
ncbi:Zinc finger protein SHOOT GRAVITROPISM 5 [Linum perenne]